MADFANAPWLVGWTYAGLSMEQIKQAVERAKASATGEPLRPMTPLQGEGAPQASTAAPRNPTLRSETIAGQAGSGLRLNEVALDRSHLEQHRIIGHDVADPRSKVFDVLRTQVLQAMDQNNWQFLAITSPTEGCGKTVTAINLALSIARQPHRSAMLIDMDLQRPTVANYLNIKCRQGVQDILEGQATLADAVLRAQADT